MRVVSGTAFDERRPAEGREQARLPASPGPGPATDGAVFGREAELASAEAFLGSVAERFAVLLVEGGAGIGKTTVWREVARRAGARGFRVLAARPAEAETKLALSAVADLLERVPAEAFAALPEPQRRALDVALLRVAPAAAPLDPRTVATAVRSLLAELSAERPLLVAIDDVQWLDPTSATVLEFALRRLTSGRTGWLLARRHADPARPAADRLVPPEALMRISLGPLTLAPLHRLLENRLDQPVSRPALARIHEASGGNPFYALEIARALHGAAAIDAGARLPLPDGLRDLVAGRLRTMAPEVRDALLAAAALSHPTVELVERASSADGLAAAEESGLLRVDDGQVAFAHPLYASAVYTVTASRRRRLLHRRLAQMVGDPEEQARHYALAAAGPDESVAQVLEHGAVVARTRGAWASAAELLEHARALTPRDTPDAAQRRAIAAAQHHIHAGDRAHARALLEAVLAAPLSRALRSETLRLLAEISYHDERAADARRLLTEALGYADEPHVSAAIELALVYADSTLMDFPAGHGHAYNGLRLAEKAGDRSLLSQALALCAMADFQNGQPVRWERVARALEIEDPDTVLPLSQRPSAIAACLMLFVGRHEEARSLLRALCARAEACGDESELAFTLLWLSWLETRHGDLGAAAGTAEDAASLAALTGSRWMRAWALAQLAYVQAHRGATDETRRSCAEASALLRESGSVLPHLWIGASHGLLELSLDNPARAVRAYEPLIAPLEADGICEPVHAFYVPDAIEALIACAELDRAGALLDAFEARGRQLDRVWAVATGARCRGLLHAARGELPGAAAAVDRAVAEHERIEMPFERARTLLVRGVIERRARRRSRAKASFEQALATFEEIGAQRWAARTRAELARLGLRRAASGELTEAERRVAELAAQGLTNREVAAALFLSPKTVDANLARVYRKLGIASRAELGARMAAVEP